MDHSLLVVGCLGEVDGWTVQAEQCVVDSGADADKWGAAPGLELVDTVAFAAEAGDGHCWHAQGAEMQLQDTRRAAHLEYWAVKEAGLGGMHRGLQEAETRNHDYE